MSESVICADAPVVTLINVFTVDPANQERLVELWQRTTDEVMRHLPGFVSANVRRGAAGGAGDRLCAAGEQLSSPPIKQEPGESASNLYSY